MAVHLGPASLLAQVKPSQVASWTEDEARAAFVAYRFAARGGAPFCEACDCDAVYAYKSRPIYKCKMCGRQFSLTSGTPWAHLKLTFKKLMMVLAQFNHATGNVRLSEVTDDLGIAYKTVWVWFHKFRESLAARAESQTLGGEVEIDGGFFGGHIRPKNMQKTKKDLRKVPYKASDKRLCVVVAKERGGNIRTWVAKDESHAKKWIRGALEEGTTVFGDQNPAWGWLRPFFQVFQVNHSQAYYTPEACTNNAESFFASMRAAERSHRHIAHHYLDLYAADTAWRVVRNGQGRKGKLASFAGLMAAMSAPGKSEFRGYWQSRRRLLPICQPDGTTGLWQRPASRSRAATVGEPQPQRPVRNSRKNVDWREGMGLVPAASFLSDPTQVPDGPGVYTLLLRGAMERLQRANLLADTAAMWTVDGHAHCYTGETYGLRTRLMEHLQPSTSNVRETLFALHWGGRSLTDGVICDAGLPVAESTLSEWMRDNVLIGFKRCGYVRDEEQAILDREPSPLNIQGRPASPTAMAVRACRASFARERSADWLPGQPSYSNPRRR